MAQAKHPVRHVPPGHLGHPIPKAKRMRRASHVLKAKILKASAAASAEVATVAGAGLVLPRALLLPLRQLAPHPPSSAKLQLVKSPSVIIADGLFTRHYTKRDAKPVDYGCSGPAFYKQHMARRFKKGGKLRAFLDMRSQITFCDQEPSLRKPLSIKVIACHQPTYGLGNIRQTFVFYSPHDFLPLCPYRKLPALCPEKL
jgi:hypothetical protein